MLLSRRRLTIIIALSASVTQAATLYAQGVVAGRVSDSASGRPLPKAQVRLDKIGITSLTGADGAFSLGAVPAGSYTLVVRGIGYLTVRRPVTVQAAETTLVLVALSKQRSITRAVPSDTCALWRTWRSDAWEQERDFIHNSVREMSERLGFPVLGGLENGRSEIRYWEGWSLALDNHVLRIVRVGDVVTGELVRWWIARNDDGLSELSVDWAEAHRQSGRCDKLELDAKYYVCHIRLEAQELPPFLSAVAQERAELTAHESLPPLDTASCPPPSIVLDPEHTVLEVASPDTVAWYALVSALGVWPNELVLHRLETAAWEVERRYWVHQPP